MKKITVKKMIESSNIPPELIRAVIRQSGGMESFTEMARDLSRQADAGFYGWTYHKDTVPFAQRNKKHILALAEDDAENMGEGVLEMISSFGCLKSLAPSLSDLAYVIHSGRDRGDMKTTIYNCLAWYAAESVARLYDDLVQEGGE